MKGRANYLCRHKLYALRDSPLLSGLEEIEQFHHISTWESTTPTGDRAELSHLPENSPLWHKLDARTEACLGSTCPDWERCFITQNAPQAHSSPTSSSSTTTSSSQTSTSSSKPAPTTSPRRRHPPRRRRRHLRRSPRARRHRLQLLRHRPLPRPLRRAHPRHRTPPPRQTSLLLRHRIRLRHPQRPLPHVLRRAPHRRPANSAACPSTTPPASSSSSPTATPTSAAINALKRLEGELDHIKNVEETKGLLKRTGDIRQPPQIPPRIRRPQHRLLDRTPRHLRRPQSRPRPIPAPLPHPAPGHPHRRLRLSSPPPSSTPTPPSSSPPPPSP